MDYYFKPRKGILSYSTNPEISLILILNPTKQTEKENRFGSKISTITLL
jgi:hypothetical protein